MRALFLFALLSLTAAAETLTPIQIQVQKDVPADLKFNVVFLGEGFQHCEMPKYRKLVRKYKDAVLKTAPFSEYKKAWNFWRVDIESTGRWVNITDEAQDPATPLGVKYNAREDGFYSDQEMEIDKELARGSNFTARVIVIIVNTDIQAGSEGDRFVYVPVHKTAPDILVHELGHAVCLDPDGVSSCLHDEYITEEYGNREFPRSRFLDLPPNLAKPDCHPKTSFCDPLDCSKPLPQGITCERGGFWYGYGVYHSHVTCKMHQYLEAAFCPVCSRVIRKVLWSYKTNGGRPLPRPQSGA